VLFLLCKFDSKYASIKKSLSKLGLTQGREIAHSRGTTLIAALISRLSLESNNSCPYNGGLSVRS